MDSIKKGVQRKRLLELIHDGNIDLLSNEINGMLQSRTIDW